MRRLVEEHLDKIEDIEEKAFNEIENLIKNIDIDAIVENPSGVLGDIVVQVERMMQEKYKPEAAKHGIEYAKKMREKIND